MKHTPFAAVTAINGQKATYSLHVRRKGIGLTYVNDVIRPDECGRGKYAVDKRWPNS